MHKPALLALEDGTVFKGVSIGAEPSASLTVLCSSGQVASGLAASQMDTPNSIGHATATGEVVFNTAMTGYQEILTDPSYSRQIVTLTYPHIGNTGINPEDFESSGIHVAGLVIKDLPRLTSNWRSTSSVSAFLTEHGVAGIADIDTRRLTRHLRKHGAQAGSIVTGDMSAQEAITRARGFPGLAGLDLAQQVTCKKSYRWTSGSWDLVSGQEDFENGQGDNSPVRHVVAMDFGVKRNILRMLADRGCRVTVVPGTTNAEEIIAMSPDGVFLSNGPGDPEPCEYAITAIRRLIEHKLPLFGICLGHQLLALASGARTEKMKFGHHGANHPVQDVKTGKVMITSQNHGFAVDAASLGPNLRSTHISLFDGTLQGVERTDAPAFGFQGHPEASPGPHDAAGLFDRFIDLMQQRITSESRGSEITPMQADKA